MAQRGWFYVLIGLLISSFLGGAIHVIFSPERMRLFVETKLAEKQPKFNIEFKSAKLQLADNWWPTIAIEVEGIGIKAKDNCITNSTIYIDKLIIPIQLSMLFSNKIKFGHVRAEQVRFFARPKSCEAKNKTVENDDEFVSLENFFQRRWSKEVVNTTRYIDELSINSLEFLRDDQALSPAKISNLNIRFFSKVGESELNFSVKLGKPIVGEVEFGDIKMSARVQSDFVTLSGKGNLKEGQFQISTEWAVNRGDISFKIFSQDLPTQNVLNLMHHWGIVPEFKPTLKNEWLSCDITMQGAIRNFLNLPVNLHQCRLYGDLGEMTVATTKIDSLKSGGDFSVQIQNLNVKAVLSGLGMQNQGHWMSQFGYFTGDLRIFRKTNYELIGDIRSSEIYWANSSGQLRQKIERFFLKLNFDGEKFIGSAKNFVLSQGQIRGGIEFSLSPVDDGHFKINFSEIQLPAALQNALWNGILTGVNVSAEGDTEGTKIKKIDATIRIHDFQTREWALNKLKMLTKFSDNIWSIKLAASSFELKSESKWHLFLKNLVSFSNLKTNTTLNGEVVQNISSEMVVTASGEKVEWRNLNAALSDKQTSLRSDGSWTNREGLDGLIKATYPKKSVTWFIFGEFGAPQIKSVGGS